MFKNILLLGLVCSSLMAESFETFLHMALKNSPYLQASALSVEQAKQQGEIYTRYKNPSLELELSRFEPNANTADNGYRAAYMQPLRLWNVADGYKQLSDSQIKKANSSYMLNKALFIKDISLGFIGYAQSDMLLDLAKEALTIAQKIYDISDARYKAGTISKGLMLQAKIDYEMAQINYDNKELLKTQRYYALLQMAGITQHIELESSYDFSSMYEETNTNNPDLLVLQSQEKEAQAYKTSKANSVEYIDLYAEFEKEPDQDIARFGLNIPLAIFNNRSQERQIATLEAKQFALLLNNKKSQTDMQIQNIAHTNKLLHSLEVKNKEVLQTERELLKMFEEGYKIANINLLQLQSIKNKLIETKMRLIKIKTTLNTNHVTLNYLQGKYND